MISSTVHSARKPVVLSYSFSRDFVTGVLTRYFNVDTFLVFLALMNFSTCWAVEEIITYKSGKQKTKEKQYTATCLLNGKYKMVMIDLKENKNSNE